MNVSHFFAFLTGVNLLLMFVSILLGIPQSAMLGFFMVVFNGYWTRYYANKGEAE